MLKKLSLVSLGNIINSMLGLTFLTAVARTLDIDDFGRYALLSTLLPAIAKGIDFGSNSIFVARAIKHEESLKDTFLTLKLLLFLLSLPVSFVVLKILNLNTLGIFLIFTAGLLAYGFNLTFFTFFQKLEKFGLAVGLNTIPAFIKFIVALAIFAGLYRPNLTDAFGIFSLSMIFGNILAVYLPKKYRSFKFSTSGLKNMIIESIPAGISLMVNNGWTAIANSVAKIVKTFTDVGIYSIANKIGTLFTLISLSLFTVLLPKNAFRKKENLSYNLTETVLLSLAILVMAFFTDVVGKYGLIWVFGEKYSGSADLLGILIYASAFTAIHTFVDNYYFVEERTQAMLYITLLKLGVFLGLAFWLTPLFDLRGLALAQLYSSVSAALISFLFIYRHSRP